jgi:DNA-binding CsgD family transcriptional regulator
MTWPATNQDQQLLANADLTFKEHEVVQLTNRGLSQRTIALALGISRSAVQSRLENATRKIQRAKGEAA